MTNAFFTSILASVAAVFAFVGSFTSNLVAAPAAMHLPALPYGQAAPSAAPAEDVGMTEEAELPVEEWVVISAPLADEAGARTPLASPRTEGAAMLAGAYQYLAPVYERPSRSSHVIGRVLRGTMMPSTHSVPGEGCRGSWHRLEQGFVCIHDGFHLGADATRGIDQRAPSLTAHTPYEYAMVSNPGAPRFYRVPTADELRRVEAAEALPEGEPRPRIEVVERWMEGDYFVAIDRREETEVGEFVRTVRGRWVRAEDLEPRAPSRLVGEELDGTKLPLAFVPGETTPLFRIEGGEAREVGMAMKYARLHVVDQKVVGGQLYVVTDDGLAMRRDEVRIAEAVEAPKRIPGDDRWVHVNLDEQVLVAYEGGEPRYATLIASGKEGWDTPSGLHRMASKAVSITMSGADPREGYYEVEDVPWTMYYDGSYALHGAYWHDSFGNVRSHGCTNIAPADARWLYGFVTPRVPAGWHMRLLSRGSWVYLTRAADEADEAPLEPTTI